MKAITVIRPEPPVGWQRADFRPLEIALVWSAAADRHGPAGADSVDENQKSTVALDIYGSGSAKGVFRIEMNCNMVLKRAESFGKRCVVFHS
jgi:hypothetical protein